MRPTALSVTDSRPQLHRPLAAGIRLARDRAQGGRDQNSCANQQRPALGAAPPAWPGPSQLSMILLLSLTSPWPEACLACWIPPYLPVKGAKAPIALRGRTAPSLLIARIPGTGRRIIHASALTLRGSDTSNSSVTCHAGATPPLPSDEIWGNRPGSGSASRSSPLPRPDSRSIPHHLLFAQGLTPCYHRAPPWSCSDGLARNTKHTVYYE